MRMRTTTLALALISFFVAGAAAAQPAQDGRKQARATRIAPDSIRIDGRIDDQAWRDVPAVTDFVQVEPNEGAAPADPMAVMIAYDDSALYIAARMHSSGPIQFPLSRRDDGAQAEYIQIELDTYLDRRTAYMFGVTAAGVRMDHYHATDDQDTFDNGFDPVWQAATQVTPDGWTAELWIPFSQLRFFDSVERVWGLNIKRWVPSTEEQDYWAPVLRTERGWASRFGDLRGINGVQPKQRLEALPYTAATSRVSGDRDSNNPFDNGLNLHPQIGADLKVGVGSSLTLDATINPDFGQVEADPAEVNLSATETIFPEKRPFFLEGDNRLHGHVGNFYYSRCIGARPIGAATGDYVDYPRQTTILGAAKLTGRLASGTSMGFLGALTDEEQARVSVNGVRSKVLVAPRTAWGIARVQQEFGDQGSLVGGGVYLMDRQLPDGAPLAAILANQAISGNADTELKFGDRAYALEAEVGFTYVNGTPAAIERVQRSTVHLFQSPDRPGVHFDPTRTSLSGLHLQAKFEKVGGRHWLYGSELQLESPEFEANDFGRVNYSSDIRFANMHLTYRETQPGRYLRAYSFTSSSEVTPYWGWDTQPKAFIANTANLTFNNFWVAKATVTPHVRGEDIQLTRGGPSMLTPNGIEYQASLRNRTSAPTAWSGNVEYSDYEDGSIRRHGDASLSLRPSPQWQLTLTPTYTSEMFTRQYVTARPGGRPETYGGRYIFGSIDRTTLSTQFRVNYTLKPDMTIDVYAEPFAASGRYVEFGELDQPKTQALRIYGTNGTSVVRQPNGITTVTDGTSTVVFSRPDFNVRSFRSNVVLRWEWRAGSTLYVVWQQDRSSEDTFGDHVGPRDLFGSFSAPGDNIFVVKTTFWVSR